MKKNEFLSELRKRLAGLSESDVKQSLDYYEEMIDDRMEEGLTEEAAVAEVGTPATIAEDILKEMSLAKLVKARVKPNRKISAWEIVLLVLGSPIWLSLLIALFVAVLSLFVAFGAVGIAVIISVWVAELALGAGALAGICMLPMAFTGEHIWAGIALFGAGVFLAGLTVLGFYGCLYATKGTWFLGKKLFSFMKSCFIRKEAIR